MKIRDFNNWFEAIQNDKTRAIAESAAYNFLYLTEAQAERLWNFYVKKEILLIAETEFQQTMA